MTGVIEAIDHQHFIQPVELQRRDGLKLPRHFGRAVCFIYKVAAMAVQRILRSLSS
ncbi:MAG: hypothetical protein ACLS4A_12670 [Oscillospiraceae bacterium]